MKFSWKLINYFIELNEKNLIDLEKKLTLSGIEIEHIEHFKDDNDKVIELSITSNRRDISSALNLAIEISIVTNNKLRISPIQLYNNRSRIKQIEKNVQYTRVHIINKNCNVKTPDWLLKELSKQGIRNENALINIQKYIETKWGKTFEIINPHQKDKIEKLKKRIHYLDKIDYSTESIFLTFSTTYKLQNKDGIIYNSETFYENLYLDSIQIISTILQTTISKYYEFYTELILNDIRITVKKSRINQFLGNTNEQKFKFLTTHNIQKILEQLQLYSTYNRKNKSFKVNIPLHRCNDLKREIDIVEEIGRIYRFQNFFNTISQQHLTKTQVYRSKHLKKIRNHLRYLGLHEVVNCCLTVNEHNKFDTIRIYNPVSQEQPELRLNIIENLIRNYKYNLKYTENNIEIFEIGKVFNQIYSNEKIMHIEKQNLGGLIYNHTYYRKNWSDKSSDITFFHAKGIIETFLENINAKTKLIKISNFSDFYNIESLSLMLKNDHQIGIYDKQSNQAIGIFGELKPTILNNNEKRETNVFIFEISLEGLMKTIDNKNHLNHIYKAYSKYPCVTRDISVKIKKSVDVDEIKEIIIQNCKSFIESIDIFNEYTNEKAERYVGIRATYRAKDKTLNKKDIQILEENLQEIANNIEN